MNIYVGNLTLQTTEDELRQAFEAYGQVESINLIKDKATGESRGFGFVQMPNPEEGKEAIAAMNGNDFKGNTLKAEEAKPRPTRSSGTGGGRGGHGGGGGGFGGRGGGRRRGGFGGGGHREGGNRGNRY